MSHAMLFLAIVGQLVSGDDPQLLSLSSASSEFSQKLYQRIARDQTSVIYSPYSIHSVLTMTSLGARRETLTEMRDTLGITSLGDSVHGIYKELIQQYDSMTNVEVYTGSALFVKPTIAILPKFTGDISGYYLAKASLINMSDTRALVESVNGYIALKTKNNIRNVLQPGQIDGLTVTLLVNTIFFNGSWDQPFETVYTSLKDFKQTDGQLKKVHMMRGEKEINVKRDKKNRVDIIELPFEGGRLNFYIALPRKVHGITDLEDLLATPNSFQKLLSGLSMKKIEVQIPKFRTESTFTIKLTKALQDMGMVHAFLNSEADFSGMSNTGDLFLSGVVHNAVIEVQEFGIVAAASTLSIISSKAGVEDVFIADHPFVYFLRDTVSGQILFQGKFSG